MTLRIICLTLLIQISGNRGYKLHYAQASILCLLGFDKIRADYYQAGSYGFDFTSVNPEPTDIVQQINSGDLFKGNKIDTDNLFGKPMPRG